MIGAERSERWFNWSLRGRETEKHGARPGGGDGTNKGGGAEDWLSVSQGSQRERKMALRVHPCRETQQGVGFLFGRGGKKGEEETPQHPRWKRSDEQRLHISAGALFKKKREASNSVISLHPHLHTACLYYSEMLTTEWVLNLGCNHRGGQA